MLKFQWLTVFLQLYISAYARACRVEPASAPELKTLLTSWLSEVRRFKREYLNEILQDLSLR